MNNSNIKCKFLKKWEYIKRYNFRLIGFILAIINAGLIIFFGFENHKILMCVSMMPHVIGIILVLVYIDKRTLYVAYASGVQMLGIITQRLFIPINSQILIDVFDLVLLITTVSGMIIFFNMNEIEDEVKERKKKLEKYDENINALISEGIIIEDLKFMMDNIIEDYEEDKEFGLSNKIINSTQVLIVSFISISGIITYLTKGIENISKENPIPSIIAIILIAFAIILIAVSIYWGIKSFIQIYYNSRIKKAKMYKYCIEKRLLNKESNNKNDDNNS